MLSDKFKQHRQFISDLLNNFDWAETREGVLRESRARVLLLGLVEAGKSSLLNRIFDWTVSTPRAGDGAGAAGEPVEDFGLFCLVDLPHDLGEYSRLGFLEGLPAGYGNGYYGEVGGFRPELDETLPLGALDPLDLAEGADLLVYVLDGAAGARPADYRWVGRLRRLGLPLLVVLNKCDLLEVDLTTRQAEMEARLATTVLPVSALTGTHVADQLLPRMINLCPGLTVALGRELSSFRPQAARRLIQRAALLNGLIALEPIPLIDLPIMFLTLTGLMLRIGAVYDRPPSDVRRREVITAVAGGLAARFAAQQLVKLVPVIGWLVSSAIGWSGTWMLGRAAVAYFEAGGDAAVDRGWQRTTGGLTRAWQAVRRRWPGRSRLRWRRKPAEPVGDDTATGPDS